MNKEACKLQFQYTMQITNGKKTIKERSDTWNIYIPYNCHFFYTDTIFGEQNLHRKTPIFRVKSVKKRHFFA